MNEDLTPARREELRVALTTLIDELTQGLDGSAAAAQTVELDQAKVGRLSRMDAMQQQQMAKAAQRGYQRRLALAKSALSAMDGGDYGFCKRCEEPIGFKRLQARPESPFCLECQGASERG